MYVVVVEVVPTAQAVHIAKCAQPSKHNKTLILSSRETVLDACLFKYQTVREHNARVCGKVSGKTVWTRFVFQYLYV